MDLYPALRQLADAYGIATEFWDWQLRHVDVPAETVVKVLAALDVDASTPEAAERRAAGAPRRALAADAAAVAGDPRGLGAVGRRARPAR